MQGSFLCYSRLQSHLHWFRRSWDMYIVSWVIQHEFEEMFLSTKNLHSERVDNSWFLARFPSYLNDSKPPLPIGFNFLNQLIEWYTERLISGHSILYDFICCLLFLYIGGTCQSPALPALVRPPAPPLQPSLDIKPFLPFPLDTTAAVNLFPNFNAVSTILKGYFSSHIWLV